MPESLDLDALREKAEKATPGPWLKGDNYLIGGWWVIAPDKPAREDCHRTIADLFIHGKDAEYVAAVSPDVMLALLAENERLREALTIVLTEYRMFVRPQTDQVAGAVFRLAERALAGSPAANEEQQ